MVCSLASTWTAIRLFRPSNLRRSLQLSLIDLHSAQPYRSGPHNGPSHPILIEIPFQAMLYFWVTYRPVLHAPCIPGATTDREHTNPRRTVVLASTLLIEASLTLQNRFLVRARLLSRI
jgi:hypothetical protein